MSQAPYMPVFTDALIGDTLHLSAAEFGAYMLLLFATWRNNGTPLPDDDRKLARICRVSTQRWKQSLRERMAEFFNLEGGCWRQKRLEKEWAYIARRREQNSQNAAKGRRVKALKRNERAPANETSNELANPTVVVEAKASPPTSSTLPPSPSLRSVEEGSSEGAPPAFAAAAVEEPARDFVKELWDRGLQLLGPTTSARNLLGKLRREYGDVAVIDALGTCEAECPSNPVAFLTACLRQRGVNGQHPKLSAVDKLWWGFAEAAKSGTGSEDAQSLLDSR